MKRTCIGLILSAMSAFATASDWVPVWQTEDFTVEVETSTMQDLGTQATFWERKSDASPQRLADGTIYDVTVAKMHLDCINDRFHLTSISYARDGREVASIASLPEQDIRPDSIGDVLHKRFCQ